MRAAHGLSALLILVLAGCGSVPRQASAPAAARTPRSDPVLPSAASGRGGYYKDDGPGDNPPSGLEQVPDAQPRIEPYSRRGNRPYVVFGKTYTPFTDERPFVQRGTGSWYGKKFHGQRTSSGELYDMYKMTAAHPTLPIPSYARLTSIVSGKQVVVRINDRGPFHASRVIDVSYTAALKLGFLGRGSHELHIERLLGADIERMAAAPAAFAPAAGPPDIEALMRAVAADVAQPAASPAPAPAEAGAGDGFYLQLGAFSRADMAQALRARLEPHEGSLGALEVVRKGRVFRLYGGPFPSRLEATQAAQALPVGLGLIPVVVRR